MTRHGCWESQESVVWSAFRPSGVSHPRRSLKALRAVGAPAVGFCHISGHDVSQTQQISGVLPPSFHPALSVLDGLD